MNAIESSWFLAQTKPRQEKIALRNLVRQQFDCFLPMETVTSAKTGRFVSKQSPLFPGYIFCSFNPLDDRWPRINATLGMKRLIYSGNAPAKVPSDLIKEIRARCDPDGCLLNADDWKEGDRVKVTSGPFTDFPAEILQVEANQRVWVLLEIMGSLRRVEIEPSRIRAI